MTITTPTLSSLRDAAASRVGREGERLIALSHALHEDPELAFAEHRAAGRLADVLRDSDFEVSVGVYGLDTAVEAVYGTGELRVVVCAEYDALPGLGHACGHNIIAAAGTGTALALADVADDLGLTVVLLGTPAEEHGGGKVHLLEAGAWNDAALSVMVHPGPGLQVSCSTLSSQAVDRFRVVYEGRAAHAAAAPFKGVNAADAATVAQVAIGLLRQQLRDDVRMSAFVELGGEVTNIIPARTVVEAEVRAIDLDVLDDAKQRMLACFEAGALATGCSWTHSLTEPRYEPLAQDPDLARLWDANIVALGRPLGSAPASSGGSTDMGNVSQYLPAIHPGIAVLGSTSAPHTIGFAADAATSAADTAVLDAARALSTTVIDAASDRDVRARLLAGAASREPYAR